MNEKLYSIRNRLDDIDKSIIKALAQRQQVVKEVAALKLANNSGIRDLEREEKLLNKIRDFANEVGLDRYYAEHLFREIITNSVRYQTHSLVDLQNKNGQGYIKVSYQGTDGAYSHLAAVRHFEERHKRVDYYGYDTFKEAARALKDEQVDYAMLPIENTTAGSINDIYDILGVSDLHIIGEEIIKIVHCLLAVEPVDVNKIRRIFSHPKAIEQCTHFLSRLPRCTVESYLDTAISAKRVLEDGNLSQAAIAGAHAAELYGLHIIEHDIANQLENYTRFVVVSREAIEVDPQFPSKTSLMMVTSHQEGSLVECLNIFHRHGINVCKLESRPRINEPFRYSFYVDIEANVFDSRTSIAIDELRDEALEVKIFGSYPKQLNGDQRYKSR
ncbi:MAG: bifunctional chorismate mutase/prephenate dehydratase [Balneola sp.]|nr:bifunctional chorismate mutase/prephenate dehydratase [Balneola sp.]|tara:strand:- start:2537 stop:3697 length:1161 start_codon:yes stop_codon:yes gene_type:complete